MDFRTTLQSGDVVLLEGAIGTELRKHGLQGNPDANLTHPETVLAIQRAYAEAGVHAIKTNTFNANRPLWHARKQTPDIRKINEVGVRLAREAAGPDRFVLGSIGPTGLILETDGGEVPEADAEAAFREQMDVLFAGGVHGAIMETMNSVHEALCALRVWKHLTDRPAIVSLTFEDKKQRGFRTLMGNPPWECAARLTEAGADAVGINCVPFSGEQLASVVREFRSATHLPILVEPNAGQPVTAGETTSYDLTPDAFAMILEECRNAGAKILGGCCGTTPAHIKAAAERLHTTR